MIETCLLPAGRGVAVAAAIAVFSSMSVFSAMAMGTLHSGRFFEVSSVTGLTSGCPVFSMQLELRLPVVIELQTVPGLGLMASAAFLSKTSGVDVVELVTRKTVGRDSLVAGVGVALHAGDFLMPTVQWKLGG